MCRPVIWKYRRIWFIVSINKDFSYKKQRYYTFVWSGRQRVQQNKLNINAVVIQLIQQHRLTVYMLIYLGGTKMNLYSTELGFWESSSKSFSPINAINIINKLNAEIQRWRYVYVFECYASPTFIFVIIVLEWNARLQPFNSGEWTQLSIPWDRCQKTWIISHVRLRSKEVQTEENYK